MSKIFNKDKVEMILMGPAVAREKNILSVIPLQCFCFINYFNIKYLSPKFETWVGKRLFSNVKVKQYNKQTMQLFVPRESETTGGGVGWGGHWVFKGEHQAYTFRKAENYRTPEWVPAK